jgi:predicted enzyme related to lactoylglutathione lyase
LNVTFDCLDSELMARFWSEITGWPAKKEDVPGNPYWVVAGAEESSLQLVFVTVSEVKGFKNRLHLDLLPRGVSQAAELARFETLGAHIVDDRRHLEPGGWVVMEDPEGNEFCLEGGGS